MKIFALSCVPYRRHTGALHLRLFFVVVGKMHFCVWLLVCREVQGAPMGAKTLDFCPILFVYLMSFKKKDLLNLHRSGGGKAISVFVRFDLWRRG